MTITWIEGFDLYNSTNNGGSKYISFPGGNSYATGRFGVGQCLDAGNAAIEYAAFGGAVAQFSYGAAYKVSSLNHELLQIKDGSNNIIGTLQLDSTGTLKAWRGDFTALLGSSSPGVIAVNTWNYVEVEWVKSATVGVFKVYVNGVIAINLTNVNTGTTDAQVLRTYWPQEYWMDDIYCTNTSTKLGECRVDTVHPTADTADKDWTPSAGTDNYAMVDETTFSTTDYLSSSTAGDKDYYACGDLSFEPATVHAVQVTSLAKKDDATTRTYRNKLKSSSTEASGATRGLGTSYTLYSDIFETDPNGSVAWTQASVNSAQVGIEVVS